MCKKKQFKYCPSEIDSCMRDLIRALKSNGIETLGCCCGHGKYPMTIIYRHNSKDCMNGNIYDFISGWGIPRKKKFYKKDSEGYYYIPEVSNT